MMDRTYFRSAAVALVLAAVFLAVWVGNQSAPESAPETGEDSVATAMSSFNDWMSEQTPDVYEGIRLAQARRGFMEQLIRHDPERAISEAVSYAEWSALPAEVQEWVEEPFSAVASVEVLISCSEDGSDTSFITTFSNADSIETFVYGDRLEMLTKESTPLQGIRLGAVGALRQEIFQSLDAENLAAAKQRFPEGSSPSSQPSVAALAGGKIYYFQSLEEVAEANQRLAHLDQLPGPDAGTGLLFEAFDAYMLETGGIDFDFLESSARQASLAWTGTPRTMHTILVDFPDLPGAPTDGVTLSNTISAAVNQQIWEMSYGKTHIVSTVDTNLYHMPLNSTVYTNSGTLHAEALSIAGVTLTDYDTVCVCHKGPGSYAGLASVGGRKMWLKGYGSKVITHELGHNYGARHASFWEVSGSDPVDPSGTGSEYGDFTDIMGSGGIPEGHFSTWHKKNINWFDSENWSAVNESGSFRVYRLDHHETIGDLRGLEIDKGDGGFYWVGYVQAYNDSYENFANGVHLAWKQDGDNRSYLIDTTPLSEGGKYDSGLALGRTYSDADAGVHITPVAKGGSSPDEWVDIVVNVGDFPGNSPPTAVLQGPTNEVVRSLLEFTVVATDSDGDELAYAWDVEDGFVKSNEVTLSYAQVIGGTVTVSCVVSDMKGGTATVSQQVQFRDGLDTWTKRDADTTEELTDILILDNDILVTGAQGGIYRSTNAIDWSQADLGSNRQIFSLIHDGEKYIGVGVDYDFNGPGWEAAVFTSADGENWTRRFDGGSQGIGKLYDIVMGGGVLVAVGRDGAVIRSVDGINWTPVSSGSSDTLEGIAYGEGRFIAVGGDPTVLVSTDGTAWTDHSSGVDLDSWKGLAEIEYCKDRFMAGGWYAGIVQSDNQGIDFSSAMTGGRQTMTSFIRASGVYFGVGTDRDADPYTDVNMISLDGLKWIEINMPAQDDRHAVAMYNDTFITVGKNGAIWQSGPLLFPDLGYDFWKFEHSTELGSGSDPADDADGDGSPNVVEYALGSSAFDANDFPHVEYTSDPAGYLNLSVKRKQEIHDVNYTFERSPRLSFPDWSNEDTVLLENSDTNLTARSTIPISEQTSEYLRLKIELK